MKYPCRCEIVDVTGKKFLDKIPMRTPEVSKPHIGKQGLAEMIDGKVKITLDDGSIIYGYECWWKRIDGVH